jgi:importin subunit alpha-6/7
MENPDRIKLFSNIFDADKFTALKETSAVELRKTKREELVNKRRNLDVTPDWVSLSSHYPETYTLDDLGPILSYLEHTDNTNMLYIAQAVRKITCIKENSPIDKICSSEFIKHLPSWLARNDFSQLQYECLWICTNIASSDRCSVLKDLGIIPLLVNFLTTNNVELKKQSIWAIGNIASNSAEERDLLLSLNALDLLIQCLDTLNTKKAEWNLLWSISNICRKSPLPDISVISKAFPVFFKNLSIKMPFPLTDILWAITSYISSDSIKEYFISHDVIKLIVSYLYYKDVDVQYLGIKIVGSLCAGSEIYTQVLLEADACLGILKGLESRHRKIRKEAAWALANICSETPQRLDFVFDANLFDRVICLAQTDSSAVKSECVWVLCNTSAVARPDQIVKLVNLGVLQTLVKLLDHCKPHINIILQGITKILECGANYFTTNGNNLFALALEECEGIDTLAKMQFNRNVAIAKRAESILKMINYNETANTDNLMDVVNQISF